MPNGSSYGGDLRWRLLQEGSDGSIDGQRINERLVALDIYKDIARFVCSDLGNAFRAGAMVGACHAGLSSKGLDSFQDALVIRGDQDFMDGLRFLSPFIDMLNHGLAG
jgi:hypothetical protein